MNDMNVQVPHHFDVRVSHGGNNTSKKHIFNQVSGNNILIMLAAKTGKEMTTSVAIQAFKDYQNAQPGIGYQVRKYAASVLAYGTMVVGPVSAVVGAAYYILKDPLKTYVNDPMKFTSDILTNKPMISPENVVLGMFSSYSQPAYLAATIGGVVAVDLACKKATGYAPVKSLAKWTVGMISSTLLYAAYKAGEMTTSSYERDELEKAEIRKRSHQTIFNEQKDTYDGMACEIFAQCDECRNSPKEMRVLQARAIELEARFPVFKKELAKLKLTPSEVDQIMDKFVAVIKSIKELAFDLRASHAIEDQDYNRELLSILSKKEFAGKAISKKAQKHIELVKSYTLGVGHTLRSVARASVSGLTRALAVEVAIPALLAAGAYFAAPALFDQAATCFAARDISLCQSEAMVVGALATIPAVVSGLGLFQKVYGNFSAERQVADGRKEDHLASANSELATIYHGVAISLEEKANACKQNPQAMSQLKTEAERISEKIPGIKAEIKATRVIDPAHVIEYLEQVLKNIIG